MCSCMQRALCGMPNLFLCIMLFDSSPMYYCGEEIWIIDINRDGVLEGDLWLNFKMIRGIKCVETKSNKYLTGG